MDTLYDVVKNKRNRTAQSVNDVFMDEYLRLCVELKESHFAKDGLHLYKNIYQNVNIKSIEELVVKYLERAETQADVAKKNANNAVVDVEDLEALNSPETILLRAVSGESSQDRADRDLLAPWLKFVWESYKQCLDLLKNNNKFENLYQKVAKSAFKFCEKYKRKTEFRKLCETIRQHTSQSQKYQQQANGIDLSKPDTQNLFLSTRFEQLKYAITMQLWQEAYKAVEDINDLMNLSKSKPKPNDMYHYYTNLSLIFWKADNYLFHAATLQKLFILLKEQKKNISAEELAKRSTQTLLATLSIPIPPNRLPVETLDTDEMANEKLKRLSSLLNLQQPPTRLSLLKDLVKYNIVQYVYPEVKDLYEWLEVEFHPLKLTSRVNACLEQVVARFNSTVDGVSKTEYDVDITQYVVAIKDVTVMRLLKQVSQVYTTIEISRFIELAPSMDRYHLEKLVVDAAKNNDLQVRINQQTKSLQFGNDLYVAQREDIVEGPNIQSMPSEQIRTQLIQMSNALHKAVLIINQDEINAKRAELVNHISGLYKQTAEKHHIELLNRKQLIEQLIEHNEKITSEKENKEKLQREEEERKKREEEERRHKQKMEDLRRKRADDEAKDLVDRIGEIDLDNNEQEKLKQIEQLKKEKRELDEKLKKEEKRVDHFIRACHEVELEKLKTFSNDDITTRRIYWERQEVLRIENLEKERQIQSENRDRLNRMAVDRQEFIERVMKQRNDDFKKKMDDFQAKLILAREARLAERKEQRKLKRRQDYLKDLEEKKRKEEESRKAKEDEEIKRKLNEQAEKQRQRDREVELKQQRQTVVQAKENIPEAPKERPRPAFQKKEVKDEEDYWRRPPPPSSSSSAQDGEPERPKEPAKTSEPYRPRFLREREQQEREPQAPRGDRDRDQVPRGDRDRDQAPRGGDRGGYDKSRGGFRDKAPAASS